jgi:hypothetical protein
MAAMNQIELRGKLICVHAWGRASSGGARKKNNLMGSSFKIAQKIPTATKNRLISKCKFSLQ